VEHKSCHVGIELSHRDKEHHTPAHEILCDLQHAAEQIPAQERTAEAEPLRARSAKGRHSRRRGPQQINTILVAVLARWGIIGLESEVEARGPDAAKSETST
jgi:hypothetical protein